MTLDEYYMEKGMEKGRIEGMKHSICSLLTNKFGDIPEEIHEELNGLPLTTLEKILKNIFEIEKIEDVRKYMH